MIPLNPQTLRPSRRSLLTGALIGGVFVLGFQPKAQAQAPGGTALNPFQAYLRIAPDGRVTVISAHFDMGQGIYHGLATLAAEELSVPLSQVSVEGGASNPRAYGNLTAGGAFQFTGGSSGIPSSWERYRRAGATAREMLRSAAAAAWNVPVSEVLAENGQLTAGSRRAGYGDMIAAAARLPVPSNVALKPASQWTLIGKTPPERIDSRDKTNGSQNYTLDMRLPGMLIAVVAHPPRFGATVQSFDAAKARAVRGVVDVVQIPRGVAVVADTTWAAIKGREALTVTWNEARAEKRGSADLRKAYLEAAERAGAPAANRGDADAALGRAARLIEATYEFPYLAHAAIEPLGAVVRRARDGTIEIWGGHQMPDIYQTIASQIAGVTPDQIKMHVMKSGGGFGRRAVLDGDVVAEAVSVAKAINWRAPVKLTWTREDDMTGGRYRPMYVHKMRVGLDAQGRISGWHQRIVGQSIMSNTPFEGFAVRNGVDATSVEGASDTPYQIADLRVEVTNTSVGVPVLWWRAVGHTHTAYAVETMIDEIASATGKDPVQLRRELLAENARERAVLDLAADKAGWTTEPAPGRFRGVAVHQSFKTYVALVVEISMSGQDVRVERVVAAVDCGIAINPDNVVAQIEGGIGFGLGAILGEELTLTDGVVDQKNYDSYTPLRIDRMPKVEVHILPSTASPTGVGEPGTPPIGPALANAVAKATGRRVRLLPFAKGMTS